MLEQLLIFTRGGLILWTCKEIENALRGSPIDTLIRSCLLEERSGAASYNYDAPGAAYTLKCTFHNELGLVFVAVYQRMLHLLYLDELLALVKREFSGIYDPKCIEYHDFDDTFRQLRKEAEARAEELKKSKYLGKPENDGKKQGQVKKVGFEGGNNKSKSDANDGDGENGNGCKLDNGLSNGNHVDIEWSRKSSVANGKENASSNNGAFDVSKLQKLRSKGGKKTDTVITSKDPKVDPKKMITKKNRVWDDSAPVTKLDFTDHVEENGNENIEVVGADQGESMMDKEEIISSDSETDEDEEARKDIKPDAKKKGKANLENADLEPALKALKDRLMTKNVAEEIAEKLCESVAASREGKKQASFTRISSTVQAAIEEALVRILTPRRSIDILRDVHAAKEQKKPYVVVSVGVNGVGKSTNLAKKFSDLSTSSNPRLIDGILLTKFDTIDDKVRVALSMVYISGSPVMFVGSGQSNTDLKKLSVKSIAKTLLK